MPGLNCLCQIRFIENVCILAVDAEKNKGFVFMDIHNKVLTNQGMDDDASSVKAESAENTQCKHHRSAGK